MDYCYGNVFRDNIQENKQSMVTDYSSFYNRCVRFTILLYEHYNLSQYKFIYYFTDLYITWNIQSIYHERKKINFRLQKPQFSLFAGSESEVYRKFFGERCQTCGSRLICNGCSNCGQCGAGNAAK